MITVRQVHQLFAIKLCMIQRRDDRIRDEIVKKFRPGCTRKAQPPNLDRWTTLGLAFYKIYMGGLIIMDAQGTKIIRMCQGFDVWRKCENSKQSRSLEIRARLGNSGESAELIPIQVHFNSVNIFPIELENDMGRIDGAVGRFILAHRKGNGGRSCERII